MGGETISIVILISAVLLIVWFVTRQMRRNAKGSNQYGSVGSSAPNDDQLRGGGSMTGPQAAAGGGRPQGYESESAKPSPPPASIAPPTGVPYPDAPPAPPKSAKPPPPVTPTPDFQPVARPGPIPQPAPILAPGAGDDATRGSDEPAMELHAGPPDDLLLDDTVKTEERARRETSTGAARGAEDVRFTAYRPESVTVTTWFSLLVYAHVAGALDAVAADALRFKEQLGDAPKATAGKPGAMLVRGTELRIVPTCEGVTFNPESVTLRWIEDWHRAEFRFKAAKALAGTDDLMRIDIYAGPLLVSQIKAAVTFTEKSRAAPQALSLPAEALHSTTASMYRQEQIFVSYSHKDTPIATRFRDTFKALGFDVLIDIDKLRAGEKFDDALMRMIDDADIFQLCWSENSAQSEYVRKEYTHALSKGRDGFIRPIFWEKPPAPLPAELKDIHFAYVPFKDE